MIEEALIVDREHVGSKIAELRKFRRYSQRQLGERIGVTGSRISQIEADPNAPPDDVLLRLAAVLGDDILRAARWGPYGAPRSFRQDALVALWRIRIDVLRDTYVVGRSGPRRLRAERLADELEAVACRAPETALHIRNNRLDTLDRITAGIPPVALRMIAAEAISMMMDAPVHLLGPDQRPRAREAVVELLNYTCGLQAKCAKRRLESGSPRALWNWQDLPCAGGALGQLHALASGDESVLLLKGYEPAGWMGWDLVAGAWQVRAPGSSDGNEANKVGDEVARRGANLAAADRVGIPEMQRVSIIDGVMNRLSRPQDPDRQSDSLPHPSIDWLHHVEPDLYDKLLLARALGRHWVRQHANRLVALYGGFPELADGYPDDRLPPLPDAVSIVSRLADTAKEIAARERDASGQSDLDRNENLRNWADLTDTWSATASQLMKIAV